MVKECVICGVNFETTHAGKITCGVECSKARKNQMNREFDRNGYRHKVMTAVRYVLGDECSYCGYDTCHRALECHHVHPELKELSMSEPSGGLHRKLRESNKCILLCSNCHREHHSNLISTEVLDEILREQLPYRVSRLAEFPEPSYGSKNCPDCGMDVSTYGVRCRECHLSNARIIEWPPTHEILEMLKKDSYAQVGRDLGVSDGAIRKRLQNHPNG